MSRYELAQLNIAIMKELLESPINGPTDDACTFRDAFPPPEASREATPFSFGDKCPAT